MSLANTTVKAIYVGNGANKTFAIPFDPIVNDSAETLVYLRDETDPLDITEELLEEGALNDYTLTGAPDADSFDVNVVLNAGFTAPTSSQYIIVKRIMPLTQTLEMSVSGFNPPTMEQQYDRAVAMIQQLDEVNKRSLKFAITTRKSETQIAALPEPVAESAPFRNTANDGWEWIHRDDFIGADGPTGPTGPAGADGADGVNGVDGADGLITAIADTATVDLVETTGTLTANVIDDSITFAKMQNITSDRLVGRDTASSGDPEEISVGGGLEFSGSAGIQRSALTGDVTAAAGNNATTIANDAVTFAKMQNLTSDRLIGRDTASSGDPEEISVGGGLEFSGSAGIQRSALTGDVTAPAASNATTLATVNSNVGSFTNANITVNAKGLVTAAANGSSGGAVSRNFLYNAEWRFFQRQTPGTLTSFQDDQYGPDRWYVLTSGGAVNVQVARVAEVIAASPTQYVIQVRQADGTARQIGIAQIIPANESLALRGREATFAFYHRTDGTEITAIRAGIVEWTGTADSVTSDIVSSWANTPTLIANAAFINTPATITASSSWAQASITATFGSSMNNAIVFVWTEGTEAQNDDLYLAQMQLVRGAAAIEWPYIAIPYTEDLLRCQRHLKKSFSVDVPPSAASEGQTLFIASRAYTQNGANAIVSEKLAVDMFATPTITLYSPSTGTAAKVRDESGGADVDADAGWIGASGFGVDFTIVDQRIYRWQYKAEAEL